jgi:Putative zinc-finger
MNCQACRQHLEPYLDDELSVKDNVAVLDHVTACGACQDVFNGEKRIRDTLRTRLAQETCPVAVADRAFAAIRSDARGTGFRHWILWAPPIAAAIAGAFLLPRFLADPPRNEFAVSAPKERKGHAIERTHDHSAHGQFLEWSGRRYDELTEDLPVGAILTSDTLLHLEPRSRSMACLEEFQKVVKAKLGTTFKLPAAFLEGGHILGGEVLSWDEGWVPQVILEYGDRELAVYEISQVQATHFGCQMQKLMRTLHLVEADEVREVRIAACKGCDAVLVLHPNRAYILLSRHGRDWEDDWMISKARQLLD